MANCQECNAEIKTGKKLCEDCAKKKVAELDEVEVVDEPDDEDSAADQEDENDEQDSSEQEADCTPKAERVNRIIAAVIDGVLIAVLFGILSFLIGKIPIVNFLAKYVTMIGSIVYFAVRDVIFDSQSPGKKIMGFKVVKIGEENRNIDTLTSVLRNIPFLLFTVIASVFSLLSIGPLALFMWIFIMLAGLAGLAVTGYELFLVYSTGRRFGDKLGRTVVVKV